ncbi:hypothetical protein HUT06_32905 [Actinomadura sp. NAK00032]|uniref:hypothetical protein n=1 Tax=Actinomadura sp. NAK00032 TaxID=2742128 RepID=UPI0015921623|nr:hypothetical protein [Actinomadura sp. NAK00032]QKW38211.1 hypothetical protein HUT06_32905 [Actinomadura sp. NAK00032]
MPSPVRTRPAWSRPCLVLALLIVLLTVGCLMQLGKGAAVFQSAGASPVAAVSAAAADDLPPESGTEPGTGQCGKKTVAEAPSVAPAAQPLPVPAVALPAALAEGAAPPPGAVAPAARQGPAPPPPDLAGLCVLRI